MSAPNMHIVAAFDFDGTLTYRDTLLPFLSFVAGMPTFLWYMALLSPTLTAYGLGIVRNDIAKERILTRFLAGKPLKNVHEKAEKFATLQLPRMLRAEAMQRLRWHKDQGHRCMLVSASLELYLVPWAKQEGFNDVIGSRLEISSNGYITGRLLGANCYGEEKRNRLDALLGPRDGYTLHVYGNSRGDRELLSMADFSYYRKMPLVNDIKNL